MLQYDYDRAKDFDILAALIKVWNPPPWFSATYARSPGGPALGNCIAASRFAQYVLDLLHVECEVTVTRVDAPGMLVGWGDCRSYATSKTGLNGHAVVIGHDWLLDVAAAFLGAPGPVVARPVERSEWTTKDNVYRYTWAPGLTYQTGRGIVEFGAKAPGARIARDVRKIVGPCRPPRPYGWE